MFINSADILYQQCHDRFASSKESLSVLNLALSDPSSQITNYSDETENLKKSLESLYKVYWRRFDPESQNTSKQLEYEGYLWKKGSGITKSWQKRYFICTGNQLAYYHNAEDSDKPSGALPLLLTTIKPINDTERYNTFTIISQQKTYTLQALTAWDMNEWIGVIKNNTQYLLDHPQKADDKSSTNANISNAFNSNVSSLDNEENEILHLPYNRKCADCGMDMPAWCCINWGCCICINCSGVHRGLTTSVSKVRSLTLDKLNPYTKKLLELIGNENANKVLESCLDPSMKISPNSSKKEREDFIQLKYRKCAFVARRGQHDEVDIYDSIRQKNLLDVFKAICTMKYLEQNNELLYGALLEKSGYKKYSPLHLAASIGDPLICHLIALNTEDPSQLDDGGWSPLSYAAFYGHAEAAEVLLHDGVDPKRTIENHPYYIARSKNRLNMATMFLPYWDGDEKIPPKNFLPPVKTDIDEVDANAGRYASLEALGKMNMNLI